MINLETNYLGLKLKNPLIAGSSGLTFNIEKIKKMEAAGIAAIVVKSLFEEQINLEANDLLKHNAYPEAVDYIQNYAKTNSVENYLKFIEDAKKAVGIPIIPSINCISTKDWTDFAKKIESAGADAIELNIHIVPTDRTMTSAQYEEQYYKIVNEVSKRIKIPIAVKIGTNFSNMVYVVDQIRGAGAKGIVLFNRFYEPDIDIENLKIVSAEVFSHPADLRYALRWVAILSAKSKQIDISATTGIHDGKAAVKQLLAGAKTIQLCSTLYKNGVEQIQVILNFITEWMNRSGFSSVDEMIGKMSYLNIQDPNVYERAQFMKYFSTIE